LRFEFQKRRQHFVGVHNETLPVVAMRVCDPDRSPAPKGCEKSRFMFRSTQLLLLAEAFLV
jgi:hypothetical protein